MLKDVMLHVNLSITDCHAQCYDGAAKCVSEEVVFPLKYEERSTLEASKFIKYSPRCEAIFQKIKAES